MNQSSTALVMFLISMLPDLWNETFLNLSSTLVAVWDDMCTALASMYLVWRVSPPFARRGEGFRGKVGNGRSVPIPKAGG